MYQWRKFDFFEEKKKTKIPEEIEAEIGCCSSGRGRIVLGCRDGTVSLLDRGLQLNYSFPAHSASVLFIQQLKQRNFVVTVGEDEQLPPQKATVCLKVFDLDKRQEEGSSTSAPECIQILRIFTNQFSEAKFLRKLLDTIHAQGPLHDTGETLSAAGETRTTTEETCADREDDHRSPTQPFEVSIQPSIATTKGQRNRRRPDMFGDYVAM